jgi:hypothetical protein
LTSHWYGACLLMCAVLLRTVAAKINHDREDGWG